MAQLRSGGCRSRAGRSTRCRRENPSADPRSSAEGTGGLIMMQIQTLETPRNALPRRPELSRRSVLRGLAATAVGATGVARAGHAFAADPPITPFSYRAPASALHD